MQEYRREIDSANLWQIIRNEVSLEIEKTPLLAGYLTRNILQHPSFSSALCYILAEKLADNETDVAQWQSYFADIVDTASSDYFCGLDIIQAARRDLLCQLQSNASIKDHYSPLLFFAGYQSLQCYRLAHWCWQNNRKMMANYIQAKVVSMFGVDIHPAAKIGSGIFMDHSVAVVIGETTVIEDDVTLFQSVTLGGVGKGSGDRHPKVRKGAFIGSSALVYGNIEIGENAKIAGGAVVVKNVEKNTTVLGPLAKKKTTAAF